MYKIWVRVKGSVTGTQGYPYSTDKGIWRSDCRQEAKLKVFALYGEARKFATIAQYDFKIVENIT